MNCYGNEQMVSVRLFWKSEIGIELEAVCENLNKNYSVLQFVYGASEFSLTDNAIVHPATYDELSPSLVAETEDDFLVFLVTTKQYANNFFFQLRGIHVILSLYGWRYLTSLPFSHGLVCSILSIVSLLVELPKLVTSILRSIRSE